MKNNFKPIALLACILLFWGKSYGQIISTIAGSIAGFSGDGGPATAGKMQHLIGITVDGAGNVYVADHDNNRIRRISAGGIITTAAGNGVAGFGGDGGPATAASLNGPFSVDADAAGNLYIADFYNNRIRKVNASGIISTIAGTGFPGAMGDGGPAVSAQLYYPACVRHDNTGNLLIADNGNQRIRKINPSGVITTIGGTGIIGYTGDGGPATNARISYPSGVWSDGAGNILIADTENDAIRRISVTGIITTIAGTGVSGYSGDGSAAVSAMLRKPEDVIGDVAGNIYIADDLNNRVRKINSAGIISTIAGIGTYGLSGDGGPATAAEFRNMGSIGLDGAGNLYITDVLNHRIRKVGTASVTNDAPVFTKPHPCPLVLCGSEMFAARPIDTLLRAMDHDLGQTLTWTLITPPAHGTVTGSYSALSTGSFIAPSGFMYTPAVGYAGTDVFVFKVADGIAYDTITILATIESSPTAGSISGVDTVCPGDTTTLSETVAGGVWTCANTAASVSSSGLITAIAPGSATISYSVTNTCGTATAVFPIMVRNPGSCPSLLEPGVRGTLAHIYPNPGDGHFVLQLQNDADMTVTISDITGKLITTFHVSPRTAADVYLDAPNGIYMIRAVGEENIWLGKLIVNK